MVTTGIHLISNDNFVISAMEAREYSLIVLGHQRQTFAGIKQSGVAHYADQQIFSKLKGSMHEVDLLPHHHRCSTKVLINAFLPGGFSKY